MAEPTGQAMTQQLSWMQHIPIGRTLQLFADKINRALGFGGPSPQEQELLKQRDDLQGRVDCLLADKHDVVTKADCENQRLQDEHAKKLRETCETYAAQIDGLKTELEASRAAAKEAEIVYESKLASLTSRITTLDEDKKRLRELRDKEAQAHHDRVDGMQVQLNTKMAELEAAQTRLREMQMLTQDKDAAHQTQMQSIEEQLKAVRDGLDSFKASAEEKMSAQRAEIDAKAQQVVGLHARLDEIQAQPDSKVDLLRSALKDLKARRIYSEDERMRTAIAAIEKGLPQMIYPTTVEKRLQYPVRMTYKRRVRQMQAAHKRLLQDSKKQPESTVSKATGSGQSATDDDDDDCGILEYVLSSMKVALPRSMAGQAAKVFFEMDADYGLSDDDSDSSSSHKRHTEQNKQQQAPTAGEKKIQDTEGDKQRRKFYSKWPRKIYSHLPLDEDSIRLIKILPGSEEPIKVRMAVDRLENVSREYEALSYVCGDMQEGHWIDLNGEEVEIYPNLYKALKNLRRPKSPRSMWVDAMCINQRSNNEKSKEIQRMGPIYNQAKTVTIFLGAPSNIKADPICAFMRFLNREVDTVAISRQGHKGREALENLCAACQVNVQEVRQGFIEFCLQPWWTRIWTMQEFYLASDEPLFYWGDNCCSTAALKRDFELLETSLQDIYSDGIARQRGIFDLERELVPARALTSTEVRRISRYVSRCYRIDDFDIPRRLYSELVAKAFDPHDYIYGLRAIFDPFFGKVFVPDYRMSPEVLFACLAVYLVAVEGWADLLWWYPTRYRARDDSASWWPDFSLRCMPHELDVKPLVLDLAEEPHLNWTVENHLLHAEGYVLDRVYAQRHIDKGDGHKIFSELWQFDHCMNWNHECNEYFDQVTEADDEWILAFRDMHWNRYAEMTHFSSSFKGSLLRSTINVDNRDEFPRQIAKCVPCWDVLRWHALRIAPPGLPEALGQDTKYDEPGCLEDIFSSRMSDIFRDAFAEFFIGACIFDWGHLSIWLKRFSTASQWIASNHRYWASTSVSSSNDLKRRAQATVDAYNGYVSEIHDEIMSNSWCYSFYYVFLAYVILLDCDDYKSLANMIKQLQEAAKQLQQVYHSTTISQIRELATEVQVLKYRLSWYDTVLELFRGRELLWTWDGFRGISCPGVETRSGEDSIVVILDGLSFPAVVNDFNEKTGEGRLAGCVLLRGVDMLDRDTETAYLPEDYAREEKRTFRLR